MAQHDARPKPGERVCPVTDTKANPKLTWVVGGKTYQFCCPPCITEFVAKAKKDPTSIKPPKLTSRSKGESLKAHETCPGISQRLETV